MQGWGRLVAGLLLTADDDLCDASAKVMDRPFGDKICCCCF